MLSDRPLKKPGEQDWRTYVLVWIVDPVTGMRHMAARLLTDAEGLERVKL